VDEDKRQVRAKQITFHRKKGCPYYDISAKTNFQVERPFLTLAKDLTGKKDLEFTAAPALIEPDVLTK
jgi:GTP-binding nuclear protein Ran